jgi:hypothetical protein
MSSSVRPAAFPAALRRTLAAALAAYLVLAPGSARPALAAAPELQIVSDTTYEVRPQQGVVHVTVSGSATSYAADSGDTRYYFPAMRLVIFAGATSLAATASGSAARVTVIEADDHQQLIEVAFNRDLFDRQSTSFRLEYDLRTGASGGEVRVGANVARFPVWAIGSEETPGSSVAISLPRGFALDLQGEPLPAAEPRDGGGHVYRWTAIDDPLLFWLFATADLATITQDTYQDYTTQVSIPGQELQVVVRAWADDADWGTRTSARMAQALPILADLIGVRYFGTQRLVVTETVSRSLNGYAGIFDNSQAEDEIQVSFDADDTVTLHEAAHAWFNASLSSDRWLLEGFASWYGAEAAKRLEIVPETFPLTAELRSAAFPLADWGHPGVESELREGYAYAASLTVVDEIAGRAGTDGLAAVFAAMAADEAAYQPLDAAIADVSYSHPTNWRYFLDLLEERTDAGYADIMREWIVTSDDRRRLDERSHARAAYVHLLSRLDGWQIPDPIRRAMNAWSFGPAEAAIDAADEVLDTRENVLDRAHRLELALPLEEVQAGFEGDGIDRAAAVEAEIDGSLDAYTSALEASRQEVDLVASVGLLGTDPMADLAASSAALEAGDWEAADAAAARATATWRAAAGDGALRLAIGGGSVLVLGIGGIGAVVIRRRRPATTGVGEDAA